MYDVIIIGAGVIGSSIARELSRYQLKTLVVEKGSDVATGTSKANSGIVHAGYSEKPGTLKAKLNVAGSKMFDQLAEELEFSFERCGSLVVCFDEGGIKTLENLKARGEKNGVKNLHILDKEEVKVLEPNISDDVYAALHVPSGGIVSPYGMTLAYAENAVDNGVDFRFDYEVAHVSKDGTFNIQSTDPNQGVLKANLLINAAGLQADDINNMLSQQIIEIKARLGEYVLLDTTEKDLVHHTIFQLPTAMGKGVLVTRTKGDVILVGPTTEDLEVKDDFSTTDSGLRHVLNTASLSVKNIRKDKIITSFAGLRAHSPTGDFIIEEAPDVPGLINVAGIESPGLTAAPAIAKEVEQLVISRLHPKLNDSFNPKRKQGPRFKKLTNEERRALIAENPDYGKIICRCEMVTKGEIVHALRSALKATDVDGIKRRTRLGMGRCQGGFCHMKILEILAEELNIDLTEVTKSGGHSRFLVEENKASL